MAKVYVYKPKETDCTTIGICGALTPTKCTFHEIANGLSSLELEHPFDELNRYTCLQEDYILKTPVPVRNAPEVQAGKYVHTVWRYRVLSGASSEGRTIYTEQEEGKKVKTVPVGKLVTVTKMPEDGERWKVSYTEGKKTYTGWMSNAETSLELVESVSVSQNKHGLESVTPSWSVKEQLFRIYSVEKDDEGVRVSARHISYDFMYNMVRLSLDDYEKMTANIDLSTALKIMRNSCVEKPTFNIETVIDGLRAGNYWDGKDPITCLLDPEIGACARWSGQLVRDNNDLYILYDCGIDRGVTLEYGKNISGINYSIDTSNVATGILPMGTDKRGRPMHLQKNYTQASAGSSDFSESSGVGVVYIAGHKNYPHERIFRLDAVDATEADKGEEPTADTVRARLLTQAKQAILNGCDKPEISVSVDIKALGDSVQFARYKGLQNIFLYDYARVLYSRDGYHFIDLVVTVSEIDWDVINESMNEITLGSLANLSSSVASWQVSSNNATASYCGSGMTYTDTITAAQSTVLSALKDANSDIYKAVLSIANSVKGGV